MYAPKVSHTSIAYKEFLTAVKREGIKIKTAQKGVKIPLKGVSATFVAPVNDWHCHHKNPYHLSKDNRYSNLIVLHEAVHRLVHLKDIDKIKSLLNVLQLSNKQKEKVNELRKQCNNDII